MTIGNNEKSSEPLDKDVRAVAEEFGLFVDGHFPYEILEANGLRFIFEKQIAESKNVEIPVYPYQDEAEDILKLVSDIRTKRGRNFALCVDSFSGGGHSGLPIINARLADQLIGHDVNPKAIRLAQANAKLNKLSKTNFSIRSVKDGVEPSIGNTLYIANPPFTLKPPGIDLEVWEGGGEDGLSFWEIFIREALQTARSGDVICGVVFSRVRDGGEPEIERRLMDLTTQYGGDYSVSLITGRKIWRGHNGKKEQQNPMSIEMMYVNADPSDTESVRLWKEDAENQKAQGFNKIGYYSFVIRK